MGSLVAVLDVVTAWAASRADIAGVALVGSFARGTPGPDSDIDLVLLTENSDPFRASRAWLNEIDWPALHVSIQSWHDASYGAVWSCHVELSDATPVEFSFAAPSWAATYPCDPGTRAVVERGCCVLHDPQGLLQRLVRAIGC